MINIDVKYKCSTTVLFIQPLKYTSTLQLLCNAKIIFTVENN
jgi:hypothetical protein